MIVCIQLKVTWKTSQSWCVSVSLWLMSVFMSRLCLTGQAAELEFPEAVQSCSTHQAAEAGLHHPHPAVDLCAVLQGELTHKLMAYAPGHVCKTCKWTWFVEHISKQRSALQKQTKEIQSGKTKVKNADAGLFDRGVSRGWITQWLSSEPYFPVSTTTSQVTCTRIHVSVVNNRVTVKNLLL